MESLSPTGLRRERSNVEKKFGIKVVQGFSYADDKRKKHYVLALNSSHRRQNLV